MSDTEASDTDRDDRPPAKPRRSPAGCLHDVGIGYTESYGAGYGYSKVYGGSKGCDCSSIAADYDDDSDSDPALDTGAAGSVGSRRKPNERTVQ